MDKRTLKRVGVSLLIVSAIVAAIALFCVIWYDSAHWTMPRSRPSGLPPEAIVEWEAKERQRVDSIELGYYVGVRLLFSAAVIAGLGGLSMAWSDDAL